jgi:hypothetical protein
MKCQTCRWWDQYKKASPAFGKCRRYPPQVTPDEDVQPVTAASDYCGEYAQAPTDPAASGA